jgi:hypothetical protein
MCSPHQLLATITSTVFKRLEASVRNHKRKFRPTRTLLFKIAAMYALTNNDSFFHRCISMITHKNKHLWKLVYKWYKQLDDNNRFLLDQLHENASLWLQHRIRHCPKNSGMLRETSRHDGMYPLHYKLTKQWACSAANAKNYLIYTWSRVYSGLCVDRSTGAVTQFESMPYCRG